MIRGILILVALLFSSAARAEWHEATSTNFIVYGESREDAREFAAKLERFNYVLRVYHNLQAAPSPNRLRVFLFSSIAEVGRMAGGGGVAGYYISEARAQLMVGTRGGSRRSNDIRSGRDEAQMDAESILLHEYAHHFMFQYFPATYPTWYQEGFAEFWGATRFLPDNVVEVGHPVDYRYGSFEGGRWLRAAQLLSAQNYGDVPEVDLLYAEGWLLVRHTFENRERQRQLQRYLALINAGTSYAEAATQAFGDLQRLNSELYNYAGRSRFNVLQLPFRELPVGEIALRTLRPAEQALIEHEIRLAQGSVSNREIGEFAGDVRRIAARFPDDPFALALLTEAERLAGNRDAAEAAATRWVAVAPNDGRALMYQSILRIDALRAARSTDVEAWNAARGALVRASRLTPNNPLILEAYHDSFTAQDVLPPEAAQNALYTAMELAPGDDYLRFKVARDFEQRDMIPEAIAIIRPVAYRLPLRENESAAARRRREAREDRERQAGRPRTETAREMLARLEARAAASPAARPAPAGTQ
jgi:hypothetical protein